VNDAPTTRGRHALKWVLGIEAKGFQPFEAHVDVKSGERTRSWCGSNPSDAGPPCGAAGS